MKSKEQKLLEHDDALVKRARVLLFTRASATCFAVLMFVGLIMHAIHAAKYLPADANSTSVFVVATDTGNIDLKLTMFYMCACIFWAAIAHQYNLWVRHVDSIKFYRNKLKEQEKTETSQQPGA